MTDEKDKRDSYKKAECAKCTIEFWMTEKLYQRRQKDHDIFYCPVGHGNYYPGEGEKQKPKKDDDLPKPKSDEKRPTMGRLLQFIKSKKTKCIG